MRFIVSTLTVLNFLAWILLDIICWILTGTTLGLIGIVGFIGFCIAWKISSEATLAVKDYFTKTIWQQFQTKLKWANGIGFIVIFVLICLFYALDWFGMKEFIDVTLKD